MGALDALTQIGPMARFVQDLALILPVIAGVDWRDPATVPMPLGDSRGINLKGLRAAFYTDNGVASPTPETVDVVSKAAAVLSDAGMSVEEDRPPGIAGVAGLWQQLAVADGGAWIRRLLQEAGTTEVHPVLQSRFLSHEAISCAEFTALLTRRDRVRSAMIAFLERYDLIVCPVNAYPAMPHGTTSHRSDGFTYTRIYNLTGWPVAVVRGGTSPEGLPIGLQIVARPWREDVALAVAQQVETALGGWQRPPI